MSSFPLLSFLITLLLAAAVCTHGNEPVKDTDGNEVRVGEQYSIQPVNTKSNGGLIPAFINLTYCGLDIIQAPAQPGVPVSFAYPPALIHPPLFPVVHTNSHITIEFQVKSNICKDLPKFWEVQEIIPQPKALILIGGKPWKYNSQFKIEKVGEEETNIYKLTTFIGTVGAIPGIRNDAPELVIAQDTDEIIFVKFNKVNDPATAITSTSRVEKLGLRMFPSY